mmetsp:Transcript_25502/g.59252  ORF Transcript_25502/g.59252 Transcript_25502/m.59252 type:complete len:219 (+) Transcript_25502:464-1120(+)
MQLKILMLCVVNVHGGKPGWPQRIPVALGRPRRLSLFAKDKVPPCIWKMHIHVASVSMLLCIPHDLGLPRPVDHSLFLHAAEIDSPHRPRRRHRINRPIRMCHQITECHCDFDRPRGPSFGIIQISLEDLCGRLLVCHFVVMLVSWFCNSTRMFASSIVVGTIEHEIPYRIESINFEFFVVMTAPEGIHENLKIGILLVDGRVAFGVSRHRRHIVAGQ